MRYGIFYSIFSSENIDESLRYLIKVAENIKSYNDSNLSKVADIILHTDEFTEQVIKNICKQEDIDLSKVIFKIHRRNSGLRGMFWRFESFVDDKYDIAINAEADYGLQNYMKELEYHEVHPYPIIAFDVRQIKINNNAIAGGKIFIKPKLIPSEVRGRIRRFINLMDHVDDIDYGVDENYLIKLMTLRLKDLRMLIVVNNRLRIFNHITNLDEEIKELKSRFKNSDIVSIKEFESKIHKFNKYKVEDRSLRYLNGNSYSLNGTEYSTKSPFRVPRSEFCQTELINTLMEII